MGNPFTQKSESVLQAMLTMTERLGRDYLKPRFDIEWVETTEGRVAVTETVLLKKPFASLLHFKRTTTRVDPKVLIVAPMSGHYATLLRETVETLAADHEVYITDWHNAREIPVEEGTFGFDDYVQYIIDFTEHLGPGTHLLAVCQPTVPAAVAATVMESEQNPATPLSLTLMGGPMDIAASPTAVTEFAQRHSLEWFEKNVIAQIPHPYPGAGRLVYPGFLQLSGFISLNPEKHLRSHLELFQNLIKKEHAASHKTAKFYDEYLAVCDLPARFYLETIDRVFLRRDLAQNRMRFKGQTVRPEQVKRVALATVEGEKDDISAPGQTFAAHRIFAGLDDAHRFHHLQPGAGHYGVFSGSRWRKSIAPWVTSFIRKFDPSTVSPPLHDSPLEPWKS